MNVSHKGLQFLIWLTDTW